MEASPSDRGAYLRKQLAPGLDSQRSTVQVTRSNSQELKDDDDDTLKKLKKPASRAALVDLCWSINGTLISAAAALKVAAATAMRQYSDLVTLCGVCLVLLGGLAVSSLWWFDERRATASRWARIMKTSGFVDWPQLKDPSYVPAICAAIPIIVGIGSLVLVPWSLLTRRAHGITLFLYALIVVSIACFVQLVVSPPNSLLSHSMIDESTVESLAWQTDGVATFNRGFCQAWCRRNEAGLAAYMRGDCGPRYKTEFDEILAMFEAKDWCLEAIAHQKFELVAEYSGVSPFAGLKGDGGRALTNMRPEVNIGLCLMPLLIIATGVMAIFSTNPFNEKTRY